MQCCDVRCPCGARVVHVMAWSVPEWPEWALVEGSDCDSCDGDDVWLDLASRSISQVWVPLLYTSVRVNGRWWEGACAEESGAKEATGK